VFHVDPDQIAAEDPAQVKILGLDWACWIRSPNSAPSGSVGAAQAKCHGDFDDDVPTIRSTLATLLGSASAEAPFAFRHLGSSLGDRRRRLEQTCLGSSNGF